MSRKYQKRYAGDRIGDLTLLGRIKGGRLWKARCSCGNEVIFQPSSGQTACAKCSRKRAGLNMTVHGESPKPGKNASRLYRIWTGMRTRCRNPHNHSYELYGGRGIKVCEEWDIYTVFRDWALSNGYSDNLSIDRIDVDGDYSPDNCRWATQSEQMRNIRKNHKIVFEGEEKTMAEWAEVTGISYDVLKNRINKYGFSPYEALTLPVRLGNNRKLRERGDAE